MAQLHANTNCDFHGHRVQRKDTLIHVDALLRVTSLTEQTARFAICSPTVWVANANVFNDEECKNPWNELWRRQSAPFIVQASSAWATLHPCNNSGCIQPRLQHIANKNHHEHTYAIIVDEVHQCSVRGLLPIELCTQSFSRRWWIP